LAGEKGSTAIKPTIKIPPQKLPKKQPEVAFYIYWCSQNHQHRLSTTFGVKGTVRRNVLAAIARLALQLAGEETAGRTCLRHFKVWMVDRQFRYFNNFRRKIILRVMESRFLAAAIAEVSRQIMIRRTTRRLS
jgi:hypothetical protein